jgi:hypothetical protein
MNFHQACDYVIHYCPNEYAKAYANAGLMMNESREIKIQSLYILNNLRHWRGTMARDVKAALRSAR